MYYYQQILALCTIHPLRSVNGLEKRFYDSGKKVPPAHAQRVSYIISDQSEANILLMRGIFCEAHILLTRGIFFKAPARYIVGALYLTLQYDEPKKVYALVP
jgi:hypothetical protein